MGIKILVPTFQIFKGVIKLLNQVKNELNDYRERFIELSDYILNNPELGGEEIKACQAHVDLLKKNNFEVEKGYLDIATAFKAEYDSKKDGPTIAYMAEYDALPDIGHGCGHNLIGTISTGAGIILSKFISELGGKIVVFGTPAEETNGAKVEMVDKGAFDDVDIAMMAHPSSDYYKSGTSLAMEAVQFSFQGKSAHAAASPEKGINALDAVINTFNNINSLREHIKSDARIHGIINEGGKAPNVVPEFAEARFYIRAPKKEYLEELSEKVKNCARGASLAAGTDLSISNFEASFDNLITNKVLSDTFNKRIKNMFV